MKDKVLVTGGTGFVGMQIVLQLLQLGYKVKTTVRSMKSEKKIVDILRLNGITSFDNLEVVEADLSKDDNWDKAMEECEYVLSVASPVFFEIPKDEEEVMRPAIDGIIRVLKAAKKANIKRVVMTSNFGAVGFSNKDKNTITTEENWTNPNEKGLSVYEKSKLLAEQAAWEFMETEGKGMEFATINPVAIFGPSLSSHISDSFVILERLLNGSTLPDVSLNIVDVRDVASLHIKAMTNPKAAGQRFIASADGQITFSEIAKLLKNKRPDVSGNISSRILPKWAVSLGSLFNKEAREGALLLNMNRNVSNEKAKDILDWKPIANNKEIILNSIDSMIKFGIIK